MKLRDYQREAVDAVGKSLRAGVRSPLVVAPTGSGKSAILGQIARSCGYGPRAGIGLAYIPPGLDAGRCEPLPLQGCSR
jgi:Lhr-like helicase